MLLSQRALLIICSLLVSLKAVCLSVAIEVQGHRGCRGILPENTLPAFKEALEAGVDVLEMDLAVTRDRVLVISHDPHINAQICLNPDGTKIINAPLINELTLEEVKSYDCGRLKHPHFKRQRPIPNTRIPTLEEVFELVRTSSSPKAKTIGFNIETKIFKNHPEYTVGAQEFSELVVKAFKHSGFLDRITLQSFDFRTLSIAKDLEPSLRTVALVEDKNIDMVEQGLLLNVFAVSPDFRLLSSDLVKKLHQSGLKVIPWTLNKEEEWQQAITMEVDGIITDYPSFLIAYLLGQRHNHF